MFEEHGQTMIFDEIAFNPIQDGEAKKNPLPDFYP